MKILVTGAAGFIGFHTCISLLKQGHKVIGIDNINDYYSVQLKYDRLKELGINQNEANKFGIKCKSNTFNDFIFIRLDLVNDGVSINEIFNLYKFNVVCHLAAQPGVRYSIKNPKAYIDSNIVGFTNILECARHHDIEHFVYASSSSVYGQNKSIPFRTTDRVDQPISLYAATKKSNELMAYTYSYLYNLPTTGLRFFTVYGPWGRPDMAIYLFTDAISRGKPIKVFNNGKLMRDFTYIDDIVKGVSKICNKTLFKDKDIYRLYNIGNNKSIKLLDFISQIENVLGMKAKKIMMPMQPGDVNSTWADISDLISDYKYSPTTSIKIGINRFVSWYKTYTKV